MARLAVWFVVGLWGYEVANQPTGGRTELGGVLLCKGLQLLSPAAGWPHSDTHPLGSGPKKRLGDIGAPLLSICRGCPNRYQVNSIQIVFCLHFSNSSLLTIHSWVMKMTLYLYRASIGLIYSTYSKGSSKTYSVQNIHYAVKASRLQAGHPRLATLNRLLHDQKLS